jgi:predicted nucleotidyltransferase
LRAFSESPAPILTSRASRDVRTWGSMGSEVRVDAAAVAARVAARLVDLPQVSAIALGGSAAAGNADPISDVDLYVYGDEDVPLDVRGELAASLGQADGIELDNRFWATGDQWNERSSGVTVDLMFWRRDWMADQLDRMLVRHEASLGYSTAFVHTVLTSVPLFDRDGWFADLQRRAQAPYPDALRAAIIAKNHPVLRTIRTAYRSQIERAIGRRDRVSVLHRTTELLASYFDVLFALNRVPHPGEKRLVQLASRLPHLPDRFATDVDRVVVSVAAPWESPDLLAALDALLDAIDELLARHGMMPGPTVASGAEAASG